MFDSLGWQGTVKTFIKGNVSAHISTILVLDAHVVFSEKDVEIEPLDFKSQEIVKYDLPVSLYDFRGEIVRMVKKFPRKHEYELHTMFNQNLDINVRGEDVIFVETSPSSPDAFFCLLSYPQEEIKVTHGNFWNPIWALEQIDEGTHYFVTLTDSWRKLELDCFLLREQRRLKIVLGMDYTQRWEE